MNRKKYFLIILPLFFLVLACLFRMERTYVYTSMVDPDYAYLFNGLNLAQPSLTLGHTDHPGTPLQMLCAVTIRVTNFFIGNLSLTEDVFREPELYIGVIIFIVLILNVVLLFFLGKVVYIATGSIIKALFIQLTPFISHLTVSIVSTRLMTEPLLVAAILCLLILVFKYISFNSEQAEKKSNRYMLFFAITIGFGIAVKMTFFPLLFIPLFLFKKIKKKVLYFGCVIISFFAFIFPVINYWVKFRDWVENLFIHSERYGTGKADFVNTDLFFTNLKIIGGSEILHTLFFIAIIITVLVYFIPKLKLRIENDKHFKLLSGTLIAIVIEIFLVSKHYSPHYLIPASTLLIFSIFLTIEILSRFDIRLKKTVMIIIFLFFIIYIPASRYIQVTSELPYYKNCIDNRMKTIQFIEDNLKSNTCVIVPDDYTCSFKEFGIMFGFAWCGEKYKEYAPILKKIYPNFYYFQLWDNSFRNWTDHFQAIEILKKYKKIFLYIGNNNSFKETRFIDEFKKADFSNDMSYSKIFENKQTNEVIFQLEYKTETSEAEIISEIFCDMETLAKGGKSFTGSNNSVIENGITQSRDYALSGSYSSKMSVEYGGISIPIPNVKEGEKYIINIWRKKENQDCYLVVSDGNNNEFYAACKSSFNEKNGWEELILNLIVPKKTDNKKLIVYTWNPSNGKIAYFDDLRICRVK